MLVLGVCSELALWGENKINKVGEGRKKKRRREKSLWLRKWRRDGSAIRAVCEHALVPRNEHGPAFLRRLDGFGGCLLERTRAHRETLCYLKSAMSPGRGNRRSS